ncbi:MAG: 16S rRNA (cytosine(1402)-N(4))-methyltransferase RsmH [Clostridia bacterium]|nr:16S rRNA (cytosine(1402)-N(4))-methyltransferase RsmH [Clostridia bacterium]
MEFNHIPVLFNQTVDSLCVKPGGTYVDCTAGGGGHSAEILSRLGENGRLICIDRDPQAAEVLENSFGADKRVTVVHDNFFFIVSILSKLGVSSADGILADLGVSSRQLDDAGRGFSFHKDAPLDMRMSIEGLTAADAVNTLPANELRRIIHTYGEEKFASAIANAIVRQREKQPIKTTLQLVDVIRSAVPAAASRQNHPARRTFQALRIYVNGELDGLGKAVEDAFSCLAKGGRLSVITFHSLEDKTVKEVFATLAQGCICPKDFPVCVCGKKPQAKVFKALTPSAEEIENNPRARSAKLRTAQKL